MLTRLFPSRMRLFITLGSALVLLLVAVPTMVFAYPRQAASSSHSSFYQQTNLVSDVAGMAQFTDPNLVNAWGLASSSSSPWWVADNGTGVATLYNGQGQAFPLSSPLVVTAPPPGGSPAGTTAAPTGIVFNSTSGFQVSQSGNSGKSFFIFDTEDGTISGWNPNVNLKSAVLEVDNSASSAVYKGLAIGSTEAGTFIYATNFHAGRIEVYNSQFARVHLSGSFTDPDLPAHYAPFGIKNLGGKLYVTYAVQNAAKHDDVAGPGHGFVDVYNTNGHLLRRLISHGKLNSPWGLALAPDDFGRFSNDLLVGNFGDGHINAFNPHTGDFFGQLKDSQGNPIQIDGLWSLAFGNGAQAGATNELFFTAGINDEKDGLFGSITSED